MNQSSNRQGTSQAFAIKLTKTAHGFEAQAPAVPSVAPVTASSARQAINDLNLAIDTAIRNHTIKTAG